MSAASNRHWLLRGLQERLLAGTGRSALGAGGVTAILVLTTCTMVYESVYCMGIHEAYIVAERTRVVVWGCQ